MIAVQAELGQTPFDMPVAESEVVGGYLVEYTGIRFLVFFLVRVRRGRRVLRHRGDAVPRRLGPARLVGHPPRRDALHRPARHLRPRPSLLTGVIFWVRFSMPRLREDQLQKLAWKFLIPVSLLNIVVTAILKVAM